MNIEVSNLHFSYKKDSVVLDNASYTFRGGNAYILSGKNGAGKTTLSMLMTGLLKAKRGAIRFDGLDISRMNAAQIASRIGYLFQNTDMQLFGNTVFEELAFPYILTNSFDGVIEQKILGILERFNLISLKDSFPLLLSGGEKQRLALSTVLIRKTDFLILDEPTTSLDKEGKAFLIEVINSYMRDGGGVIVITHDDELRGLLCPLTTLVLDKGALYEA